MVSQKSDLVVFSERGVGSTLKDQSGFTLIEALVVMVVGVAVLAGAAAGIGRLFAASNVATEAQNITLIAANIKGMKDGPQGYKALTMATAKAFKAIPENMTISGQDTEPKVTNLWNGDVTFASTNEAKSFMITYSGVPDDACKQLALKLKGGGWESLGVGDGKTLITPSSDLGAINTACAKGSGKGTMIFQSS